MAEKTTLAIQLKLAANAQENLQKQVNEIKLNPIKVNIQLNTDTKDIELIANAQEKVTQSIKETSEASNQEELALKSTQKIVSDLINSYKSLLITYKDFSKESMDLIARSEEVNLSLTDRARLVEKLSAEDKKMTQDSVKNIKTLSDANRDLASRYREASEVRDKANQGIASNIGNLIGEEIDADNIKTKESVDLYKNVENELRTISTLKQQIMAAESKGQTTVVDEKKVQLLREEARLETLKNTIQTSGLTNAEREISLKQTSVKLEEQENIATLQKLESEKQLQTTLMTRIEAMKIGKSAVFADPKIISDLQALNSEIAKLGTGSAKSIPEITNQFNQFKNTTSTVADDLVSANKAGYGFFTMIEIGIKKFASWGIAATIFMQVVNGIREGIKTVVDLNEQLTRLQITMELTNDGYNKLISSAQEFAVQMHTNVSDVLVAMRVYANVSESVDSILKKTKADIILSNLSGMDITSSTDAIQGLSLQFNIADDQAMRVTNTLTKLASGLRLDFKRGVTEMTDAVKVTGEVAKEAGFSLEEYSAIIGKVIERTRLPGSTIAQGEKMIFARLGTVKDQQSGTSPEDISKAEKAYKELPIPVEIRKSATEFKSMKEILSELAPQWDKLTNLQKDFISQISGSTRQGNIFRNTIETFRDAMKLAGTATDDTTFALRKQEVYAQSIDAKWKTLKASVDAIWQNSSVSSAIYGSIATLQKLVDTITFLTTKFGIATTSVGLLTAGLSLFNKTFNAFLAASPVGLFSQWILSITGITAATKSSTIAVKELAIAKKADVTAQEEVIRSNIILDGAKKNLTASSEMLTKSEIKLAEANAAEITTEDELNIAIEAETKAKNELIVANERVVLSEAAVNDATAGVVVAEETAAVTSVNLGTAMGVAGNGAKALAIGFNLLKFAAPILIITALTWGISKLAESYQQAAQKEEAFQKKLNDQVASYTDNKSKVQDLLEQMKKLNTTSDDYVKIQDQINTIMPQATDYIDKNGHAHLKEGDAIQRNIELLEKLYVARIKAGTGGESPDEKKKIKDAMEAYQYDKSLSGADVGTEIQKTVYAQKIKTNEQFGLEEEYKKSLKEQDAAEQFGVLKQELVDIANANAIVSTNDKKLNDIIQQAIKTATNTEDIVDNLDKNVKEGKFEDSANKVREIGKAFGFLQDAVKSGNNENVKKYSQELEKLGISTEILTDAIEKLKNSFKNPISSNFSQSIVDDETKYAAAVKKADEAFASSVDNLQLLKKAQDEMNQSHKLSADTMEKIMKNYPELLDYQNDEAGFISKAAELMKNEQKITMDNFEAKTNLSTTYFDNLKTKNHNMVDDLKIAYGEDLSSFKTITDAKNHLDALLVENVGSRWQEFFDSQKEALDFISKSGIITNPAELKKLEAARDADKIIEDAYKKINEKTDWDALVSGKTTGSSGIDKQVSEKDILIDKYSDINLQIEQYNQLLAESKALEENTSLEKKNELLKNQIQIYKDLQTASHIKAEMERSERANLVASMSSQGFSFAGVGDNMMISNNTIALQKQADIINLHKKDTDKTFYNEQKEILDKITADSQRFTDIQLKDLNGLKLAYIGYSKDITDAYKSIDSNTTDITLASNQKAIDGLNERLKDLKTTYDKFGDTEHTKKINNLNDQLFTNKELITKLNKEYLDLAEITTTEDYGSESWKKTYDELTKVKDQLDSTNKSSADLSKTLNDQKIDKIFEVADKTTQDYTQSMESLGDKYDLLDKKDFAGKQSLLKDELKQTNASLKIHSEQLEKVNQITDKARLTDETFIKDKLILTKTIADETKKSYDLNDQLLTNPLDAAKDQINEFNKSLQNTDILTQSISDQLKFLQTYQLSNFSDISSVLGKLQVGNVDQIVKIQQQEQYLALQRTEDLKKNNVELYDYYTQQLTDLYSKERTLIDKNAQYKKEQTQNVFNEQNKQLESALFNGSTQAEEQKALDDKKTFQQDYMTGLEKQYTLQAIINDLNVYNNNLDNIKITQFDTQLSQMQSMANLKREDLDLLQKNLNVQKLQDKLKQQQDVKTEKLYTQDSSGKWSFTWLADPKRIQTIQDQLTQAQIDLQKTQSDNDIKNQEKTLTDKSKILIDTKTIQQNILDGMYTNQDEFNTAIGKLQNDLENKYTETWDKISKNTVFQTYLENLKKSYISFKDDINKISTQLVNSVTNSNSTLGNEVKTSSTPTVTPTYNTTQATAFNQTLSKEQSGVIPSGSANTYAKTLGYKDSSGGGGNAAFQMAAALSLKRDNGGVLPNGMSAINTSGLPEYVLNPEDSKKILDPLYSLGSRDLSPTNLLTGFKTQGNNYTTNVHIDKVVADNADQLAQQLRNYVFKL